MKDNCSNAGVEKSTNYLCKFKYEKDVIQKILEHLNLWEQDLSPPAGEGLIYEPYDAE